VSLPGALRGHFVLIVVNVFARNLDCVMPVAIFGGNVRFIYRTACLLMLEILICPEFVR
jgi:hypothetical protein